MAFGQKSLGAKKQQDFDLYYKLNGNYFPSQPRDHTTTLEAGIYKVRISDNKLYLAPTELNTDDLLVFEDERFNSIINECDNFWRLEERYSKFGFMHKRGILLYGPPGTGKSCLIRQVLSDSISKGHIVLIADNELFLSAANFIKSIEPDKKIVIVLEELDVIWRNLGNHLSEFFDGANQLQNILCLCTTNHIDQLPEKILREGRLDRKLEILPPPYAGRLQYFTKKLPGFSEETIKKYCDITNNFTFSQMKEFILSTQIYGYSSGDTISRIMKHNDAWGKIEDHEKIKKDEPKKLHVTFTTATVEKQWPAPLSDCLANAALEESEPWDSDGPTTEIE